MVPFFVESDWITKSLGAELLEFPDLAEFKVIIFLIAGLICFRKVSLIVVLPLGSLFVGDALYCIGDLCCEVEFARA